MTTLADLVTVSRRADTITLWLASECYPGVRMTRNGKWFGRAKDYNDWQATWKDRIKLAMQVNKVEPLSGGVPMFLSVTFQYRRIPHNCDLDNLVKSALDMCQGIVFAGVDSWVDRIVADRIATSMVGVSITMGRL